ncbi:hypothetical protein M413DRAFT_76005 [Hebeloma cylindrosporum]|uniref:Uncharacterized protein n=1 Tax=Hebeloma cylindrosporum TaxID=76867 RepID=A0A0C3C4G1_HEBCY|nr:hypothetical protein M413DRAFT_76005 [Hebeloma cylindrosporum h7]
MASAPPPKRNPQRVPTKSYKNTCGAPAPKTSLKQYSRRPTRKAANSNRSMDICEGGTLAYTVSGPKLTSGAWCSGCRNGGTVVLCTVCDIISMCTSCIDFKGEENVKALDFECPPCFVKRDPNGVYPHTLCAVSSSREIWPKILVTPLVIISIHLEGMTDTPSHLAYYHLYDWFRGNLVHIDMDFNLDDVPRNDFGARLIEMLDRLETGDLKSSSQFMVFITSHSDPTSGYLHIGPNNVGSVPVEEVFSAIFTPQFRAILRRGNNNILSLLSCGALSSYMESRDQIKAFAKETLFEKILSFSQANFQPSATHKFVMDWALNHFVFERQGLNTFIRDHQALGAHTDIIQFQPDKTTTFKWTHPGARPFGFDINKQCPYCQRLKTRVPRIEADGSVCLRCSKCMKEVTYNLPHGWTWLHSAPFKGDQGQGAWLVHTE